MSTTEFSQFFKAVAGAENFEPYPYQTRMACGESASDTEGRSECESMLIDIPTGMGKTAAVTMAWLWNRVILENENWPRRLVYCLPMRTLVEQTRDEIGNWLDAAYKFSQAGSERDEKLVQRLKWLKENPPVILMGGEKTEVDQKEWDLYPEKEAILIGTQDMLLSRALNRGYGMSRFRWPMHFGLLNNDCLWVLDETQLMGVGLTTATQLHWARCALGEISQCKTWWMSATLNRDWLGTADFDPNTLPEPHSLEEDDFAKKEVDNRWTATKQLRKVDRESYNAKEVAVRIVESVDSGENESDLTLVIANTVKRATEIAERLRIDLKKRDDIKVTLIHSRFRLDDRKRKLEKLYAPGEDSHHRIVISTQVIEAGVDISAGVLFTDLAPWPSLIQRFGRCNRKGEYTAASVYWIDLDAEKSSSPYRPEAMAEARARLEKISNVSPSELKDYPVLKSDLDPVFHVIRQKDILDLFDTTPDLSGGDIDISHFVRDGDDLSVQVFWRDWPAGPTKAPPVSDDFPAPTRAELCSVPVNGLRDFRDPEKRRVFRWDHLDSEWRSVLKSEIYPGQTYLLHISAGGYDSDSGWNPSQKKKPVEAIGNTGADAPTGDESDRWSRIDQWRTIRQHTDEVAERIEKIAGKFDLTKVELESVRIAGRFHDWGKVHPVFQRVIKGESEGSVRPGKFAGRNDIAKAPGRNSITGHPGWWNGRGYEKKHFRHELASALALLQPEVDIGSDDSEVRDLAAFLIAAHHGKIRGALRCYPGENRPDDDGVRFARGIQDGDRLPKVDLGGEIGMVPAIQLSLEPMEMGLGESAPFIGFPSWVERILTLRRNFGPFRLAFLESLIRAADIRASQFASETVSSDIESNDHAGKNSPLASIAGGGETSSDDGDGSLRRASKHGDGRGTGESPLVGGTSQPVDATKTFETSEGTLTYTEVAARLAEKIVPVQQGIIDGDYANEAEFDQLAKRLHRDICSHLVPDWAGQYRKTDVQVGTHSPPDFWKVEVEMVEFRDNLIARWQYLTGEDEALILESLAWVEGRFLSIHPFLDFNGRTIRLLLVEILRRAGLPLASVEASNENERQNYFRALRAADQMDFSLLIEIWRERIRNGLEEAL